MFTEKAGVWGNGVQPVLPANASGTYRNITSVSCASAGDCTAVGNYADNFAGVAGLLLTETDGVWATGVEAGRCPLSQA